MAEMACSHGHSLADVPCIDDFLFWVLNGWSSVLIFLSLLVLCSSFTCEVILPVLIIGVLKDLVFVLFIWGVFDFRCVVGSSLVWLAITILVWRSGLILVRLVVVVRSIKARLIGSICDV